jgi:signal peptidase II
MNSRLVPAAIIASVLILDRATKAYIRTRVSSMDIFPVIPGFFNIVHTENPGAAFGMLAGSSSPLRSVFLVCVSAAVLSIIGSILWGPRRPGIPDGPLLRVGLSLVFGGALGNLWDRVFSGTVTDFLQFFFGSYEFPSFNAADSAISVGACLLLLDLWMGRKKQSGVRSQESV